MKLSCIKHIISFVDRVWQIAVEDFICQPADVSLAA
jgi:hypothetical protein